jgi:signal transduction histidine kinase/CheY-like chemotaxis protein
MTSHRHGPDAEHRVLVFAPIGRDAELTRDLLGRASISCAVCRTVAELSETFESEGAGALLLTEEALDDPGFPVLVARLQQQAPWSDVPVLLFCGGAGSATAREVQSIETLQNLTLLERPIRVAVVLSSIRAALRGRSRQYEVRDLLVALHRARAEAESANRLKDEFLATLSHELRTPLNAILGWTSMLGRGQVAPDKLPRVFQALERNAQTQAQLIADVLDVSRIITGKLKLEVGLVDLYEIVGRAVDAVRPAAAAKNVTLSFPDFAACPAYGDADRLQQVFWNLLNNAIKFTPSGGAVTVDIAAIDSAHVVSVTDTGIGIPPEFVPFVFDRFRQADQAMTRAHGGLGLGLSIVKHLAELHGGTVSVASEGPGRGARFEVRLPAVNARLYAGNREEAATTYWELEGRMILVVDDDESTREVVSAALQTARADVHAVDSAAEARRWLTTHTPALIVADLGMPGEDGFSFLRRLRASEKCQIPAIALSAYADKASREAALAAGFDAFLAKPARPDALVEMVASLVDRAR